MMGSRSMGVDIVDLLRLYARVVHGKLHRHGGAAAVLRRRRNMERVAGGSIAGQLGVNLRAPRLRVF